MSSSLGFYCITDKEYNDILDGVEKGSLMMANNSGPWGMYLDFSFTNEASAHVKREDIGERFITNYWTCNDRMGAITHETASAVNGFLRVLQKGKKVSK